MAGWNERTSVTPTNVRKVIANAERTCEHCLKTYTLGIDGTVNGCDRCEGIVRLPNGMIDYSASSPEVLIKQEGKS